VCTGRQLSQSSTNHITLKGSEPLTLSFEACQPHLRSAGLPLNLQQPVCPDTTNRCTHQPTLLCPTTGSSHCHCFRQHLVYVACGCGYKGIYPLAARPFSLPPPPHLHRQQ
jgi:hypothetical protein